MTPGRLDLRCRRGDTMPPMVVTLPDLTVFGGPSTLAGCTVRAYIGSKDAGPPDAELDVTVVDAGLRQLRLGLTATVTATLPPYTRWDLEVADPASGWVGTLLAGDIVTDPDVTRG